MRERERIAITKHHGKHHGPEVDFVATPFRTLPKLIVGLFAATPAAATSSGAELIRSAPIQVETLTLSSFAARVR